MSETTHPHQSEIQILLDTGVAFARRLHKEVDIVAAENLPALARAFERIATAVRRTILLSEHLAKPAAIKSQSARRTQIRKTIIRRVEFVINKEVEPPDAAALRVELIDRLDTPESDQDIDFRPSADIVQEILDDMGIGRLPFQSERPRRTPEDIQILNARAARRPPEPHTPQTSHRPTHTETGNLPKAGITGLPRPPQTQTPKITQYHQAPPPPINNPSDRTAVANGPCVTMPTNTVQGMTTHAINDPVLTRYKAALQQLYGDQLERIILFGSRARGEAQQDSDYDIAVFLKAMPDRWPEFDRLATLRLDFLDETGAFFDTLPFAASAYAQRTPLMREIRRDGLTL